MLLTPTASQDDGHDHGHHGSNSLRLPPAFSRRHLLWGAAGALATPLALAQAPAPNRRETAEDALGPFYPLQLPRDQDADLTQVAGRKGRAQGPVLHVSGRVVNPRGEPVAGAVLEIWQANAAGRYAHPGDTNAAPLDPNFQGYARLKTGSDGSYRFKTVQPGLYGERTRHIHFDVRGKASRLITQMYFEGEPRNETDGLLKLQTPEDRVTLMCRPGGAAGQPEPGALAMTWDIVLAFG